MCFELEYISYCSHTKESRLSPSALSFQGQLQAPQSVSSHAQGQGIFSCDNLRSRVSYHVDTVYVLLGVR